MRVASTRGGASDAPRTLPIRPSIAELAIVVLWVVAVASAVSLLLGLALQGLGFLAALAPYSQLMVLVLGAFGVVLAAAVWYTWRKRSAPVATDQRPYRHGAQVRFAALGGMVFYAAAALALVAGALQYDALGATTVGSGQLGVVVAEFSEARDGSGSANPAALSATLGRRLRKEIASRPDLAGRVTVLSAPPLATGQQVRDFAAAHDVQIVLSGRAGDRPQAFVPWVAVFEPKNYLLWYGDVPAPNDTALTGSDGLQLDQMELDASSGLVDYLVGLIYLRLGDYKAATDTLEGALAPAASAGPSTLAAVHLARGRALAAQQKAADAAREYRLAQERDATLALAHLGLGNLSYERRDCAAALGEYDAAVEAAPQLSLARYSRGNGYFCLGRYDLATSEYREAIRLAPPDPDGANVYHLVLGATLCRDGRTDEGMAELDQARKGNLVLSSKAQTEGCLKLAQTIADLTKPARRLRLSKPRLRRHQRPGSCPLGHRPLHRQPLGTLQLGYRLCSAQLRAPARRLVRICCRRSLQALRQRERGPSLICLFRRRRMATGFPQCPPTRRLCPR